MVKAIFKNEDGSIRILNWYPQKGTDKKSRSALDGKSIPDLMHDWRAVSCDVVDYDNPARKAKSAHNGWPTLAG